MATPRGSPATKLDSTNVDAELARSFNQLHISRTPSRSSSRASLHSPNNPVAQFSALDRLTINSPSPRSPIVRSSSNGVGTPSPSGTPSLLRKASTTSMRSSSGMTPSRAPSRMGSLSPANLRALQMDEVKPLPTAASVASTYFKTELQQLHGIDSSKPHETIVILNDACYGHRFSRIKTTKGNLSTIVERPERIQACTVGVAMAYVRLGDRHCDGKFPIHPRLDPTSLPSIPFRIYKTDRRLSLVSPAVTNVHGVKWMEELQLMCDAAESKLAMGNPELKRPDMDRGSDIETPRPFHEGDLYLCAQSLAAFEGALGAICEAVDTVFSASQTERAFVAVRPPGHHCSASYPQGFCWINNVHVGIMHGAMNHGLTHAAIIDFDLHHGDGSQSIAWDHNQRRHRQNRNSLAWKKASIGYFSLHDINSYPCENGDVDNIKNASLCIDNAHGQNIWNVHLQEWKSEVEFWSLYQSKYSILIEKARNYLRRESEKLRAAGQVPKAAIFLSAGFDASEWEGAGMQRHTVNVPTEFYARLTRDVVKLASEEGLAVEGRIISALEGGYSDRALYSGVFSHLSGLAGNEPLPVKDESVNGRGRDIQSRISSISSRLSISSESDLKVKPSGPPYDPNWWSRPELDKLETTMVTPVPEPKAPRAPAAPTHYSSPTQSSVAKARDPTKLRRSASGYFGTSPDARPISRPPTPPPPDVPWPVAVHQLSKLLIPTDRPTGSLTWEDLKADANRAKRERQSLQPQDIIVDSCDTTTGVRKSLRERKPVKPLSPTELEDPDKGRRKTVAGTAVLVSEKATARGLQSQTTTKQARQHSRRVSTASTMTNMTTSGDGTMEPPPFPTGFFTRPPSAQSMRPESSMSVRTTATSGLNMRKTRPAAPARKEGAKAAPKPKKAPVKIVAAKDGPKKTTTVTKAPAQSIKPTNPTARPSAEPEASSSSTTTSKTPSVAPSTVNSESGSDLSKPTSGIKKIKINVVTKEMKEARQKAETEGTSAPRSVGARASLPAAIMNNGSLPVQTLPLNARPKSRSGEPLVRSTLSGSNELTINSAPITPAVVKAKSPTVSPTNAFQKLSLNGGPPVGHQGAPANPADTFVPYQPEGSTPQAVIPTGPIRWMPPNEVDTPKAFKKGHTFTATSAIPFSSHFVQETRAMTKEKAVASHNQPVVKSEMKNDSVWEIPETPDRRL